MQGSNVTAQPQHFEDLINGISHTQDVIRGFFFYSQTETCLFSLKVEGGKWNLS